MGFAVLALLLTDGFRKESIFFQLRSSSFVAEQLESNDDSLEDSGFSSMSDPDGETGAKPQRTSGSSSLQGQSTTSPPAKQKAVNKTPQPP